MRLHVGGTEWVEYCESLEEDEAPTEEGFQDWLSGREDTYGL